VIYSDTSVAHIEVIEQAIPRMIQSEDESEPAPRPLIEGEDYYIENGRWVFTEAYHHCPYGFNAEPVKLRDTEILP
jgi:hypothetical protein